MDGCKPWVFGMSNARHTLIISKVGCRLTVLRLLTKHQLTGTNNPNPSQRQQPPNYQQLLKLIQPFKFNRFVPLPLGNGRNRLSHVVFVKSCLRDPTLVTSQKLYKFQCLMISAKKEKNNDECKVSRVPDS